MTVKQDLQLIRLKGAIKRLNSMEPYWQHLAIECINDLWLRQEAGIQVEVDEKIHDKLFPKEEGGR